MPFVGNKLIMFWGLLCIFLAIKCFILLSKRSLYFIFVCRSRRSFFFSKYCFDSISIVVNITIFSIMSPVTNKDHILATTFFCLAFAFTPGRWVIMMSARVLTFLNIPKCFFHFVPFFGVKQTSRYLLNSGSKTQQTCLVLCPNFQLEFPHDLLQNCCRCQKLLVQFQQIHIHLKDAEVFSVAIHNSPKPFSSIKSNGMDNWSYVYVNEFLTYPFHAIFSYTKVNVCLRTDHVLHQN